MSRYFIDPGFVDRVLRHLETKEDRPYLELSRHDSRVDWESFHVGDGGLPSVNQGQCEDSRISRGDGSSLHVHWFCDRPVVRFHRDRRDPRKDPLGHLALDTNAVLGAALGTVLGLLVPEVRIFTALVGGALGCVVGSTIIPAPSHVWILTEASPGGYWKAKPVRTSNR